MKCQAIHQASRKGLALIPLSLVILSSFALNAEEVQDNQIEAMQRSLIIDDIICEGNATTECDFITKKYYQQIGDKLDPNEIADAKLRLGTLIQFKTINTRLAKGHKRGHVVVVFEVQEAKNIQYQFGAGINFSSVSTDEEYCFSEGNAYWSYYESCGAINGDAYGPSFNAAVTDFNFLGSGKQLSFGVNGTDWNDDFVHKGSFVSGDRDRVYFDRPWMVGGTRYTLSLEYYDPHLFDSSLYYFRAKLNHRKGRNSPISNLTIDQQEPLEPRGTNRSGTSPVFLEVGRRFGSHSYFSIDLGGYYTSSDDTNGLGINYGWDSQDDSLFPTQGSVFAASFRFKRQHIDEPTISLNYKKHFEIADNQVITLGNNTLYAPVDRFLVFDHQLTTEFTARYTNITEVDALAGTYSGWFVEGMLGATTEATHAPAQYKIGIRAGYTYQSDSMIYRFSLGLHHQERN